MKALVVYSSLTGNTKKIAEAMYEEINIEKDIYKSNEDFNIENYDFIAVGYWVNKGICDDKIKEILEKVNNKNIILFGTLGAKENGPYYDSIKKRIEELVPENNKILGHFLCQGKINEKLTERYKEMLKNNQGDEHVKEQLKNHEEASKHPDDKDIYNAKMFIRKCIC
ncbi:flavodoxin family protein BilS [Clostridium nigeriense]|uniref:flavodoxin family protein BilS n=1 Tax=Clostridium nigeriense TaxID=1805470 RepID=UPI000833DE35|nr:flavodoxin family protein BilS [Clostridium nigeriense]